MIDRIFTPALAFLLLLGGTLAVGHEFVAPAALAAPTSARLAIVEMPRVEVTGRRSASAPLKVAQTATRGARTDLQ